MTASREMHIVEQNSIEWFNLRLGKFTSSKVYALMKNPKVKSHLMSKASFTYCQEKASELLYEEDVNGFKGNHHTDRGHEEEPKAVMSFQIVEGLETQDGNFWTFGENGSSPDRLVGENRLLEIKCLSRKEHARALRLVRHAKGLKEFDEKFFYQAQHQLYTTGSKSLAFLFYDERLLRNKAKKGQRGYHLTEIEPIHEVFMEFEKRIKLATEVRDYLLLQMIG